MTDAFFEFISADWLWEATHPQMSAAVLSDLLRQSDKFGTDSENYSKNTFRTRLEVVQTSYFRCERTRFHHNSNEITSPVRQISLILSQS